MLEMSSISYFVAMTSVCDKKEGFSRLERALEELDNALPYEKRSCAFSHCFLPTVAMRCV